ncbi:F0F1 ATP synthase subunit delta [Tepidiphilus sp. J10]|uniref:F0F1 ATP synthase subunit delta n=1 Tax=Tepidiphilus sp. J10 TaxID=2502185 RepID=UPI00115D45E5|nr:F0F1 ATP synthase subunit delta [Tepidiphilus sp. J10]
MAEKVTIARPYAEAAFSLALGAGALEAWSQALERLAALVTLDEVRSVLLDPKVDDESKAGLLLDLAGVDQQLPEAVRNFVQMLVKNDRVLLLPEIHALFVARKNDHEGVAVAKVTSAFALDEATRERLRQDLEAHFKKKLQLEITVDPELIGGVRVQVGDEVIDASVRGKLANLAAALKI